MRGKKKHGLCDMRGFLSFQILWILSKGEMCGNGIAEEIMRRRGEKPKAGTIYPALKELKNNGMIRGKRDGKEIVYALTASGRVELDEAKKYFVRAFGEILAHSGA